MSVSLVGVGTISTSSTTATPPVPAGYTATNGDIAFQLAVTKLSSTTPSTPGGWTLEHTAAYGTGTDGAGTGKVRITIFSQVVSGGSLSIPSIAGGGTGQVVEACIAIYRPGAGETVNSFVVTAADKAFNGTSWSGSTGSIAMAPGDQLLGILGGTVSTSTSASNMAVNSPLTGSSFVEQRDTTTTSGNDAQMAVFTLTIGGTAGSSVVNPTATTASSSGGIVVMRIRTSTAAVTATAGSAAGTGAALTAAAATQTVIAFPTVQGRQTGSTTAGATTHSVTLPASVAAGELLLAFVSADGQPLLGTSEARWTKIAGQQRNGALVTGAVFAKIAEASGALDDLTVTTSVSEMVSWVTMRVSGHGGLPTATATNGSSADSDPASHTPAWGTQDYLWVAARMGDSNIPATVAPASYSTLTGVTHSDGTDGASVHTAERTLRVASEDPGAFTSAAEQWAAFTVAVPPAAVTAPMLVASYGLTATAQALTTLVTPSFTPAAGEIIVVKSVTDDETTVIGTPTGGSLTYTLRGDSLITNSAYVAVYTAPVVSSPGSMTVSIPYSGVTGWRSAVVERWTNATLDATPAVNSTKTGTGGPSATVTTEAANSVVSWASGDWQAVDPGAYAFRSAVAVESHLHYRSTRYVGYFAYQHAATATAQTIGLSLPVGQTWSMCGVEIEYQAPPAGTTASAGAAAGTGSAAAAVANVAAAASSAAGTGAAAGAAAKVTARTSSVDLAEPFEVDADVNGITDGWALFGAAPCTLDAGIKRAGSKSQKLVVAASATASLYRYVTPVFGGIGYTLSVWANVTALNASPAGAFVTKVEWYDSNLSLLDYNYTAVTSTTGGFAETVVSATAPAQASVAVVLVAVENGGTVYVDDLTFSHGTAAGRGVANQATVSTAAMVTATAGAAAGTGTAGTAAARAVAVAGTASGAGAALAVSASTSQTGTPAGASGTGTALSTVARAAALAGTASGSGTANATSPAITALATAATGTGAAQQASATSSTTASAGTATGTGTANPATVSTAQTGASGTATGTGAAGSAQVSITTLSGSATGTGTALSASASTSLSVTAGSAAGVGAAYPATVSTAQTGTSGTASGTGSAFSAAATVTALAGTAAGAGAAGQAAGVQATTATAGTAAGTGTAQSATVSTSLTATAGSASGVGAAQQPAARVAAVSGTASGTGVALAPTVAVSASAGSASGTGTANPAGTAGNATAVAGVAAGTGAASPAGASLTAVAGAATGSGTAQSPLTALRAVAGAATGTGQAGEAGTGSESTTEAPAGAASGTGTAGTPTARVAATAGSAAGVGAAYDLSAYLPTPAGGAAGAGAAGAPVVRVIAIPSAASGTGTASDAVTSTAAQTGSAAGTGSSGQPGVDTAEPSVAEPATGTGTAGQPTVAVTAVAGSASGVGAGLAVLAHVRATVGTAIGYGTAPPAQAVIAGHTYPRIHAGQPTLSTGLHAGQPQTFTARAGTPQVDGLHAGTPQVASLRPGIPEVDAPLHAGATVLVG